MGISGQHPRAVVHALFALALVASALPVMAEGSKQLTPEWTIDHYFAPRYFPASQGDVSVWQVHRSPSDASPVTLVLAVFSPKTWAKIEYVERDGPTSSVYNDSLCPGAIAVVNANFFVEHRDRMHPLGLLKIDGRRITNRSRRKSGGFLVVDAFGRVSILSKREATKAEAASNALESTPLIVQNGRMGIKGDKHDRYDRVAVGTTRDRRTVFVGAFGTDQNTVSMLEFSRLSLAAMTKRGVSTENLLGMDGGASAHFWFAKAKVLYGYRGPAYLPSAICVRSR